MRYIKAQNVNLIFEPKKDMRIKDWLLGWKRPGEGEENPQSVHALRDVTFDVESGVRLGVVGHNGAGKSTLLRTIAGIYSPTSGTLECEGKVASLFELATGFDMESTGWENIRIRSLLLGMNPREIDGSINAIAEFSGLGKHLDRAVKYYSSGMFLRLAYSVSTSIKPDILLLDEIAASGDEDFRERAARRMNELIEEAKILVFVSHSLGAIRSTCNKCLWLSHGTIRGMGTPEEITKMYLESKDSI